MANLDLDEKRDLSKLLLTSILTISIVGLIGVAALRIYTSWTNDAYLVHATGEWMALANDLKDGIFYRPLFGEYGYGGTRYFPLQFTIVAALLKFGFHPITAANSLQLILAFFLLAGLWRLQKAMGVEQRLAAYITLVFLATTTLQSVILSHRLDLLPLALNVWGLTFCVRPGIRIPHMIAAVVLFTLAFSAKTTSVFGITSVFLYNMLQGNRKTAWKLLACTVLGCGMAIAIIYIASDGRILENIRVGYSFNVASFVKSPFRVFDHLARRDPVALIFFVLAAGALVSSRTWKDFLALPAILFYTSFAVTTFIHTTSGIDYNHLLDLEAASLLVLGDRIETGTGIHLRWAYGIMTITCLIAFAPLLHQFNTEDVVPVRKEYRELTQILQKTGKKAITENNLVSILAGIRPYILNPHLFIELERKDPSYGQPLWRMMETHEFGAIVLIYNPEADMDWYRTTHYGEEFIRRLNKSYTLFKRVGSQYVFLPK